MVGVLVGSCVVGLLDGSFVGDVDGMKDDVAVGLRVSVLSGSSPPHASSLSQPTFLNTISQHASYE